MLKHLNIFDSGRECILEERWVLGVRNSNLMEYCNYMGQSYCSPECCEKQFQALELPIMNQDEPSEAVAKKVRQHIQLHSRVKQTYVLYRTPHPADKKGTKLDLYYLFNYSAYYQGQWRYGRPHGFGRIIYDDGSLYEGCFIDGVADCKQALYIKDENTFYRGNIKQNKANGYGELSTAKLFYKGNWANDLPQGRAREIYSSISFYEGNFQNGVKNGEGVYHWNSNQYYIEGMGDLTTREYQYKGEFKENKKEGKGLYIDFVNKFQLSAHFANNHPRGEGEINFKDGAKFKGYFQGFNNRKGTLQVGGQKFQINTMQQSESNWQQLTIK